MIPLLQDPCNFLFVSIVEFVFDLNITFAFGYEVQRVVVISPGFILLAKCKFRPLQHSLHPFDDIVSQFLIVVVAILALSPQLFS